MAMTTETVWAALDTLLDYAKNCGLLHPLDETFARNTLLSELRLESYEKQEQRFDFPECLNLLCDYAAQQGMIADTIAERDLFDTKLMGFLTPRPSEVVREFRSRYTQSPKAATDYFYTLSQDCNYIRRDRIAKDERWTAETKYGKLEISINLSKPEKDPRDIAAAKLKKASGYPKCLLCPENVGYAGTISHPARQNLRVMPVMVNGQLWGFQYSPYVYYNEHCIVMNARHTPMVIDRGVFDKLFSFVEQFPHYFLGSNADLPIVGGSILSHEHFQGGPHTFPMEKAEKEFGFEVPGFDDVDCCVVRYPMTVLRLNSQNKDHLCDLAGKILAKWRTYSDPAATVFAETDGEPHNTITPIARMREGRYELDLVLRNNLTTKEHPMGLYHPHEELHHIKKENIGLIEVMGLAVLPGRLKKEMADLREALLNGEFWPEEPEMRQIQLAEEDFYRYLSQVFFRSSGAVYAVWEENGRYVSALRLEPYRDGLLLEALETAPEQRRKGFAAALIRAVQCFLEGKTKLYSHVDKRNLSSLKVHEKCGFRRVADFAVCVDGSVNQKMYTLCWDDKTSV